VTAPFVRKYNVPLYGVRFYMAFADSLAAANKALPHACDGVFDVADLGGGAAAVTQTCEQDGIVAILFNRRHFAASIAAHEALHAALGIMRIAGVGPMDEHNDEAYAYVVSWVVENAVRDLNRGGRWGKRKAREVRNVRRI
jgi:hypothetical protein